MVDKFSSRRVLPRLAMPSNMFDNISASLLCSGDFYYFMKYGLALISSKIKNASEFYLIVNCVDFPIHIAEQIVRSLLGVNAAECRVYFTKTDTSSIPNITLEMKASLLRTIRYYVAYSIMQKYSVSLSVIDIDSLIVNPNFTSRFDKFFSQNFSFVIGSRLDLVSKPLHEIGSYGYLWRTVKAGFTFFRNDEYGKIAIKRVFDSLFNVTDPIPPVDALKMYRAYYGDQICLLLTFLELLSVPPDLRVSNHLSCIGHSNNDFISFTRDFANSSLWIPPASERDSRVFSKYFNFA